jgi:gamma-glutamyltranspeptidase/glutathione hydrolase
MSFPCFRTFPTGLLATAAIVAATVMPITMKAQRTTSGQPVGAVDPRRAQTQKPPLHGRHWMAITGKPLGATAGAMMFQKGGNAVDAAAAMLAATCTMWDTLHCGGETQALLYHPKLKKVIGINALGVAPTGATAEFFRSKGYAHPPEFGPLSAITPGTPGGLMVMLAEYGTLSLADVLGPAIQMAEGFPIEAQLVNRIEQNKHWIKQWKTAPSIMLPHLGSGGREAPEPGEIFVQQDLAATFRKLVATEQAARKAGKTRRQAIMAAYDRFYKGDIAQELVRGMQEEGGLFTMADLANWQVKIEEPLCTAYKGIDVCKLQQWQQGPALLQALNILENADLKAMEYNSPPYVHTLYQAMNLAFADRDFYYGDPAFAPEEPMQGLLSKAYAKARFQSINWTRNDPAAKPGDPYPFQGGANPFAQYLAQWDNRNFLPKDTTQRSGQQDRVARPDTATDAFREHLREAFHGGTTSIVSADSAGWVVSITPSGGWAPAVIAGRTGIGLSQRAQSFVTRPEDGPFNVIEPGKRPRVTLTPTLALKDGEPFLAFAVQGGDTQDQNLLQFFLNMVEFGMTVQQAVEAPNINSYQMRNSFGVHETQPGLMEIASSMPEANRAALRAMGYTLRPLERTSGPINAIWFDRKHRTMWGGSSNHGEDHGIAW